MTRDRERWCSCSIWGLNTASFAPRGETQDAYYRQVVRMSACCSVTDTVNMLLTAANQLHVIKLRYSARRTCLAHVFLPLCVCVHHVGSSNTRASVASWWLSQTVSRCHANIRYGSQQSSQLLAGHCSHDSTVQKIMFVEIVSKLKSQLAAY